MYAILCVLGKISRLRCYTLTLTIGNDSCTGICSENDSENTAVDFPGPHL